MLEEGAVVPLVGAAVERVEIKADGRGKGGHHGRWHMGERIRKYGTGFSPVARRGSVGVDTTDASRATKRRSTRPPRLLTIEGQLQRRGAHRGVISVSAS